MKNKIVPAILARDLSDFKGKLSFFAKYFSLIQIDIMDGTLVKNVSFFDVKKMNKIRAKASYELHLMVAKPEKYIAITLRSARYKRFILHYESYQHREADLYDIIKQIKAHGRKVGLAINPETSVEKVKEFLHLIDVLVVMGVNPGWSGQKFHTSVLKKIKQVRKEYPKLDIAVDGGVTEKNYQSILKAGANILDVASLVLKYQNDKQGLKKLLKNL